MKEQSKLTNSVATEKGKKKMSEYAWRIIKSEFYNEILWCIANIFSYKNKKLTYV